LAFLQLHLDDKIGAYFDYGNHTEKVSTVLPLSFGTFLPHIVLNFDCEVIFVGSIEMV